MEGEETRIGWGYTNYGTSEIPLPDKEQICPTP